jgi:hypothetical protein
MLQFNSFGVLPMSTSQPNNWPDLLIGLYDNLTGRRAEITYEFDDMRHETGRSHFVAQGADAGFLL